MPAYNFQKRFVKLVRTRKKKQTIRAKRKPRPRAGQTAYLYTGMRTKKCRLLGTSKILGVRDIRIFKTGVLIQGAAVLDKHLNFFARNDGFSDWSQMVSWFEKTHGLPFHGDLIFWL